MDWVAIPVSGRIGISAATGRRCANNIWREINERAEEYKADRQIEEEENSDRDAINFNEWFLELEHEGGPLEGLKARTLGG